jgi:CRISPR-associated protein Csx10
MMAITFLLKTLQPILATSFQGDPNSDVSYPYIPGSMIRGALIGRYLSKNGLHGDILADANVRRLFFDGTTCYLNAYLNSQTGKRTFPTLLSWRKEKGDELTEDKPLVAYDFSIGKPDDGSLENPKAVSEGFWAEEEGCVKLYSIARRINIHHSRDRSKGRATETEGEIFRYDAIDAGQTFQGVILCDSADRQILIELLEPQDIWLGGSRSAGYGHVEIIEVKTEDEKWQEIDICPEQRTHENRLKITLLSDLLLRDVSGQPVAAPPTQLIADILGIPLGEPINTYMDSTLIGGFNRKWGLPLPQVPAVRAGSVFVYEGTGITAEQICLLEEEG